MGTINNAGNKPLIEQLTDLANHAALSNQAQLATVLYTAAASATSGSIEHLADMCAAFSKMDIERIKANTVTGSIN